MDVTRFLLQPNGLSVRFSDGSTATATHRVVNGIMFLEGFTEEQAAAVEYFVDNKIDNSVFLDPRFIRSTQQIPGTGTGGTAPDSDPSFVGDLWGFNNNTLYRSNADGTSVLMVYDFGGITISPTPHSVLVDRLNQHVYWAIIDNIAAVSRIVRINTDGSGFTVLYETTTYRINCLTAYFAGDRLYLIARKNSDSHTYFISMPLDASPLLVESDITFDLWPAFPFTPISAIIKIAHDPINDRIIAIGAETPGAVKLMTIEVDGTNLTDFIDPISDVSDPVQIFALDVDPIGERVYYGHHLSDSANSLKSAALDGSDIQTEHTPPAFIYSIAAYDGHIYYVVADTIDGMDSGVYSAPNPTSILAMVSDIDLAPL